jgi:hypothetical protein
MPVQQVCLGCYRLTGNGSRCQSCKTKRESMRNTRRDHYQGDYQRRSAAVRKAANADPSTLCWLCHTPARLDDPWTADHVLPGDPHSPLMPAHRSCNSRRGDGTGRRGESAMRMEHR